MIGPRGKEILTFLGSNKLRLTSDRSGLLLEDYNGFYNLILDGIMVETINQFGWAQVAGIAGAALVCLMALVGILLGTILKRTGRGDVNGGGVAGLVGQVKQIQRSIDQEITDRKEDFNSVRQCIDKNREDERLDINTLHAKLEKNVFKVIENFQTMCMHSQQKCATVQAVKIDSTNKKVALTCRTLDSLGKESVRKWEKQELVNAGIMAKIQKGGFE